MPNFHLQFSYKVSNCKCSTWKLEREKVQTVNEEESKLNIGHWDLPELTNNADHFIAGNKNVGRDRNFVNLPTAAGKLLNILTREPSDYNFPGNSLINLQCALYRDRMCSNKRIFYSIKHCFWYN